MSLKFLPFLTLSSVLTLWSEEIPTPAAIDPQSNLRLDQQQGAVLLEKLRATYSDGYRYAIDNDLHLVFAVYNEHADLDVVRSSLAPYAAAQQRDLFTHPLQRFLAVIIPKDWRGSAKGWFNPTDYTLTAKSPGAVLTHEFTHALHMTDMEAFHQMHQNWIIEGLATLFEDSHIIDEHAQPQPNYRLKIIQNLVRGGHHVPFETYVTWDQKAFMKAPGNHYSQARYMLFYLHQKNLLKRWYDAYVASFAKDATGAEALRTVCGKPLAEIEKEWAAWILSLPPWITNKNKEKEKIEETPVAPK
jgi:hypothetical protein